MLSKIALKDQHLEMRIYNARTAIAIIVVLALLGIVLARYYSLQINEYEVYRTQSDRNRVQLQPLPPKRGLVFDRNGVLLADNRPSFILSVVRERAVDLDATLARLREIFDGDFKALCLWSVGRAPAQVAVVVLADVPFAKERCLVTGSCENFGYRCFLERKIQRERRSTQRQIGIDRLVARFVFGNELEVQTSRSFASKNGSS